MISQWLWRDCTRLRSTYSRRFARSSLTMFLLPLGRFHRSYWTCCALPSSTFDFRGSAPSSQKSLTQRSSVSCALSKRSDRALTLLRCNRRLPHDLTTRGAVSRAQIQYLLHLQPVAPENPTKRRVFSLKCKLVKLQCVRGGHRNVSIRCRVESEQEANIPLELNEVAPVRNHRIANRHAPLEI